MAGYSKFLLGFLLVGFLLLAGCTSKQVGGVEQQAAPNNQQSASPSGSASANPNKNVENGAVGSVYKIKYLQTEYEVTLKEAKFAQSDNAYIDKAYAVAFFEIKNVGTGTDFFAPTVYGESAGREKIDRTIAIGLGDEYQKSLGFAEQLNPGQKTSGWVAFEVPKDATSLDVFFEYSNPFVNKTPQYIKYTVTK